MMSSHWPSGLSSLALPAPGLSSPPGPSLPARSQSPSPAHPGGTSDDDNNTPPCPPSLGLRPALSKEPAAPLKKSRPPPSKPSQQTKKAEKPKPTKKPATDMTDAERWKAVKQECREWFRKRTKERKRKEMEPPPVDPRKLYFFIKMSKEAKKMMPQLSNYDRALVKADERKKRKGKSSSSGTLPHLEDLLENDAKNIVAMLLDQQTHIS